MSEAQRKQLRQFSQILSDMQKEGMSSKPDHVVLDSLMIEALERMATYGQDEQQDWSILIIDMFRKIKGIM
jgi:hypothetical protein